jgi:uncharacterized protein (TIGR02186 family)
MMLSRSALLAVAFAATVSLAHAGEALVTQLAQARVDITTRFTGEKILVFGALTQPGDVIVKVVSPDQPVSLSRKVEVGLFWLDGGNMILRGSPGFMYLLSSAPLDAILDAGERERFGLDLGLALGQVEAPATPRGLEDWRSAFIRLKKEKGRYLEVGNAVKLVSHQLFHAEIPLPAKVPLGLYRVDIYLANGGKIVAHETQTLDVNQVKLQAWVADAARTHSWLFGGALTLVSLLLGLGLGMVLRRASDV